MQPKLDKVVILLSSGIAQRKLYFADHPKVKGLGRDYVKLLTSYLDENRLDHFFIGVVDSKLVYEGKYLVGPSIAGGQLVKLAELLHCGGFSFERRVTPEEVSAFFGVAADLRDPLGSLSAARAVLQAADIRNITVAAEYDDPHGMLQEDDMVTWQGRDQGGQHLESPIMVYQALYDVVTAAHGNAALDRMLDMDNARSVSEYLLQSTRSSFTDIIQIMHYPDYDSYTVGHSVRVATLAVHLGDKLGLSEEQLLELGTAGLLHDVGKSKIPDEILFKPGRLDKDEFTVMQSHARLGAEILMEHKTATPLDVAAAWGHHLRHDGGGYPARPSWAVRDNVTKLLQVCDVFEALTAIRPYKAPMTPHQAFEIMLGDEGGFDPTVLSAFIRTLGLYPPGNKVRLSDGSRATVVAAGDDVLRPLVQLTADPDGQPLPDADDNLVNLGDPEQQELSVAELLLDTGDPEDRREIAAEVLQETGAHDD
jgi:putative nucleotidyltransferase with HDIG domain